MALKFILLILLTFLGYTFGFYITEKLRPAERWKLFDFKAFRCRPCCSFHCTWVLTTFAGLLMADWIFVALGFLWAGVLFAGLKIDEKNKNKGYTSIFDE